MLSNIKSKVYLCLLFSITILSCTSENEIENDMSFELNRLLLENSPNNSISYFELPNPNDFGSIPQDPKNVLSASKVELGKLLFHETAIALDAKHQAGMGTYSCASCHHAKAGFQAGRVQGVGDGGMGFGIAGENRFMMSSYNDYECDVQPIRTPSVLNVAYQPNLLWNGKLGATATNLAYESNFNEDENTTAFNNLGFEGVETQAIVGLGVHRLKINEFLEAYSEYVELFNESFSQVNNITRENAGLAIAAYERTLMANEAPFQKWLKGDKTAMSENEMKGAILFFGKAGCVNCHSGPSLASMEYYALGMKDLINQGEIDTKPNDKAHLGRGGFTNLQEDMFKFKVPQLYNLKDSEFYGHGASFRNIKDVVEYKNKAIPENNKVMQGKLSPLFQPLNLTEDEINLIATFIEVSLYDDNLTRYVPNSLPSENCFPNNDIQSKIDLGCE